MNPHPSEAGRHALVAANVAVSLDRLILCAEDEPQRSHEAVAAFLEAKDQAAYLCARLLVSAQTAA